MSNKHITAISFESCVEQINDVFIVRLPETVSAQLPSRGQVAMEGTLSDKPFKVVLEPDGNWGHWFKVKSDTYALQLGDLVSVSLEVATKWPEPEVPSDFATALKNAPIDVIALWPKITPLARWEWVRWINETANPDTRQRRVEVSISKMSAGKRRPCCFNLAACTDPSVSKSGRLLISNQRTNS